MRSKGLLRYLHDHDGYASAEYEGNCFTLPGHPMMEKQQVAMQLKYVKECLEEIHG